MVRKGVSRAQGTGNRVSCSSSGQTLRRERPRQGLSASVSPLPCFSSFCRTVPQRMWSHFWKVSTQGLFVAMFWPLIPQFVCNCLFYWALYFNPIINIDLVVKEVRRLETQVL